ncbi:lipid-A-disaccharide synthase [Sessilibacter sp. MAH4]
MDKTLRIGLVVGEASGDTLAVGLMKEIKKRYPDAIFEGIGGPKMIAQGFNSFFDQERLAVMGLIEPLKRLPELLKIRREIIQYFSEHRPDVFVGVDSPDFNLTIEEKLRAQGIKTTHYVSPSVWAWRQGRVKKIARACDLMLTLLPFEAEFYKDHNVAVEFVGHPLANEFTHLHSQTAAQQQLHLKPTAKTIAIMPGSREAEVRLIAPEFLQAAAIIHAVDSEFQFVIPAANEKRFAQLQELLKQYDSLPVTLVLKQSKEAMMASNFVMIASGTTTLEAMLLGKPMVIGYRMAWLSFQIMKALAKIKHVGLPNLLAGKTIVPELLQNDLSAQGVADVALEAFSNPNKTELLTEEFHRLSQQLRQNANLKAADAILKLIS